MITKIPQNNKAFSQPNTGEVFGNLYSTFGIDLRTNKGKIRVSPRLKQTLNSGTDANLAQIPTAFAYYLSRYYAVAGGLYQSTADDPTTLTSQVAGQTFPSNADMLVFNSLLLITQATTIQSWNGSAFANWWATTLGQSALAGGNPHILKIGRSNGALYLVNNGTDIYKVVAPSTVTISGNGVISIAGRGSTITCMDSSSNRMWIGTKTTLGNKGQGEVIEWDMASDQATFNRAYQIGAQGVLAMCIENDVPVIITTDGTVKKFDGSGFSDYTVNGFSAQLPIKPTSDHLYNDDSLSVQFNGMKMIDDLVTISIRNILDNVSGSTVSAGIDAKMYDNMGSGLWQVDPTVGLYHRYPFTLDSTGQLDWGQDAISGAGALFETKTKESLLLAGARYWTDDASSFQNAIFCEDKGSTLTKRAIITFPQIPSQQMADTWQKVVTKITQLISSTDRIFYKYRTTKSSVYPFIRSATYTSTTTFTSTDTTFANAQVGDEVQILTGKGAPSTAHITAKTLVSTTYTVTVDDTIFPSSGAGKVRINNWTRLTNSDRLNYFGTLSLDKFEFPIGVADNWIQLRMEIRGTSGDSPEIEQIYLVSETNEEI